MTPNEDNDIAVSFAEVASEDPSESVAYEAAVTDVGDAPGAADAESRNDDPPTTPTVSSMLGIGPVGGGDDVTA